MTCVLRWFLMPTAPSERYLQADGSHGPKETALRFDSTLAAHEYNVAYAKTHNEMFFTHVFEPLGQGK